MFVPIPLMAFVKPCFIFSGSSVKIPIIISPIPLKTVKILLAANLIIVKSVENTNLPTAKRFLKCIINASTAN